MAKAARVWSQTVRGRALALLLWHLEQDNDLAGLGLYLYMDIAASKEGVLWE